MNHGLQHPETPSVTQTAPAPSLAKDDGDIFFPLTAILSTIDATGEALCTLGSTRPV